MKHSYLLFLTFFILSYPLFGQHGIAPEWGTQVELPTYLNSTEVGGFLYSNMAVLSNNKRIILLNKKDSPTKIYLVHSYDGINWSSPQAFEPVSVVGLNSPKLISDANDNIHIIWASNIPRGLYYTQMDSSLTVIKDSVKIGGTPRFNTYKGMYISADANSRLHVMWHEGDHGLSTDTSECFYSRSLDGGTTWSAGTVISTDDSNHSAFPRGQFNAYGGDSLAISWRNYVSTTPNIWDVQMVTSTDGGANWSTAFTINGSSSSYQGDPDFVIAPNGRYHLFYHDGPISNPYWGMRIVYAYSDDYGQTWTPSSFTDSLCNNQRSYLAEGSRYDAQQNVLWTFWKEEDLLGLKGGDMMATFSLDNGLTWSNAEYVTDNDSVSIGFKSVALLPNGGLATNYERPNFPNTGEMRVFYNERQAVSVGLQKIANVLDILVYPNPTAAKLYIDAGNRLIDYLCLFDLSGKMMLQQMGDLSVVDLSLLGNGVYFLQLQIDRRVVHKKIVVAR